MSKPKPNLQENQENIENLFRTKKQCEKTKSVNENQYQQAKYLKKIVDNLLNDTANLDSNQIKNKNKILIRFQKRDKFFQKY